MNSKENKSCNKNYNLNNYSNSNSASITINSNNNNNVVRNKQKNKSKKHKKKKTTDTLNELNKLTDKLGITNKSERIDYIKEKEKKKLLKKEFRTPFKEKNV